MKRSFEIKSDCLDIIKRIKAIDENYFLKFNLDTKKFELHHRLQRNTYCLTFPYETLDERAYDHTLKTRVQNSDKLFEEMEKENVKLEKAKMRKVLNDLF